MFQANNQIYIPTVVLHYLSLMFLLLFLRFLSYLTKQNRKTGLTHFQSKQTSGLSSGESRLIQINEKKTINIKVHYPIKMSDI